MDLNKLQYSRAYSPYRREALYCLWVDFIIIALCSTVLVAFELHIYAAQLFWILPLYLLVEIFVNYRIAIFSMIEEHCREGTILKTVFIENFQIESSASGHWGSVIPNLYPEKMGVNRYKIKGTDSEGQKIVLRCAMSFKNAKLFDQMIEDVSMKKRTVIVGKYSHIIVKYCDKDDFSFMLSRRL